MGGVLLGLAPSPLFFSSTRGKRKKSERGREGRPAPSSLSYSDSLGGGAPPPYGLPYLSPMPM